MQEKTTIILDTNILVSLLIGSKKLDSQKLFSHQQLNFVFSEDLLQEFEEITQREKFQKYFSSQSVKRFIAFIQKNYTVYNTKQKFIFDGDKKDSFLFDLMIESNAAYLITGDKILLNTKKFNKTEIISYSEFMNIFLED